VWVANLQSYRKPAAWYRFDSKTRKTEKTAPAMTSVADFSDCKIVREFATSKDGTKIPLNFRRKKGTKLDGNNPTLLYAYGGDGVSMTPGFSNGFKTSMLSARRGANRNN